MIRKAYYAIVDWFMDSTAGPFILTLAIIAAVGLGLPTIFNAVSTQLATGYTGQATITSHYVHGSFCFVDLDLADGSKETKVYGPRLSCNSVNDGSTVNLVNGRYV